MCRPGISVAALLLLASNVMMVCAEDILPADRDLFETHVRPVLVKYCIKCHGPTRHENGLQLDSAESILTGGDSGPAVIPGQPEQSLLLQALRYESLEMPPDGPLEERLVRGIRTWIDAGAQWPNGMKLQPVSKSTAADRNWWCYQPIEDPPVPDVVDNGWCRNEVDQFIFDRMSANDVEPSNEAAPSVLARRVHFAVTGLPPDQSAVRYVDGDDDYEMLVNQLLDSPTYGENQARFWLDLVRYADSDGYRSDGPRPFAKLYRDYVIRSFNADKPYDRFVVEQLAGDETDPGNRDAIIATMFLRHGIYEQNQPDVERQWREILDDITETTADVFLAQGIKCARCHDHKFDPITQQDYFRIRAFFEAIQPTEVMPVANIADRTQFHDQQSKWLEATDTVRRQIHNIETPVLLQNATGEPFDKFVPRLKAMMLSRPAYRSPYEHQIASLALRQMKLHPGKLAEQLDKATEAKRRKLRQQLSKFDSIKPTALPTLSFVVSDVGSVAPPTYIPDDPNQTPIAPGFLSVFNDGPAEINAVPTGLQSTGRRSTLAGWITDPANPLTARVIVNRIWQQHFGHGLVNTSSDFGHLGTLPSHPQLLDWLASRFVEDGWSLRKLHHRILTSSTWRQTSQWTPGDRRATLDPDNRLLWRMDCRRLSSEEIVDTILYASGELETVRRAVYRPVMRNKHDPLLATFDFPDRIRSIGQRHRTTTPPQALLLMNSPWVHDRATAMAETLNAVSDSQFIQKAYRRLYFRNPEDVEITSARRFMKAYGSNNPETPAAEPQVAFLHTLFNSSELIYVD